jgi:hypothetical protein
LHDLEDAEHQEEEGHHWLVDHGNTIVIFVVHEGQVVLLYPEGGEEVETGEETLKGARA